MICRVSIIIRTEFGIGLSPICFQIRLISLTLGARYLGVGARFIGALD